MRWSKWQSRPIETWHIWPWHIINDTPKESLDFICGLHPPVRILQNNIYQNHLDGYLQEINHNGNHIVVIVELINSHNNRDKLCKIILGHYDAIQRPELSA